MSSGLLLYSTSSCRSVVVKPVALSSQQPAHKGTVQPSSSQAIAEAWHRSSCPSDSVSDSSSKAWLTQDRPQHIEKIHLVRYDRRLVLPPNKAEPHRPPRQHSLQQGWVLTRSSRSKGSSCGMISISIGAESALALVLDERQHLYLKHGMQD